MALLLRGVDELPCELDAEAEVVAARKAGVRISFAVFGECSLLWEAIFLLFSLSIFFLFVSFFHLFAVYVFPI